MNKYKLLGISSGRPMGNAEVILKRALMACEQFTDADVHLIRLRSLKIAECDGCMDCMEKKSADNNPCKYEDDFEWLKKEILWADAIIFSDPCFCYMPTAEVINILNRAEGVEQSYKDKCREGKKLLGMITVGGSDTVDFSLPLQYLTMQKLCPGIQLIDQFYANWVLGKGRIAAQDYHMERADLLAKRLVNKLNGYDVPAIETTITNLASFEYTDDSYKILASCPVCHQSVVHMDNTVMGAGNFTCSICGSKGHVEHHNGVLSYVWDDDSVAHNRLHKEYEEKHMTAYNTAHSKKETASVSVKEFRVLTPQDKVTSEKPLIVAVVSGAPNGTSELLARKALENATSNGKYEGAIVRINDLNIKICSGCLICKTNNRYKGLPDQCIIKDDDDWLVDLLLYSSAIIWSFDGINGMTCSKVIAFLQRFGHFSKTIFRPHNRKPAVIITSSFEELAENAVYPAIFLGRFFTNYGPIVDRLTYNNVPLIGDGILSDEKKLAQVESAGIKLAEAVDLCIENPAFIPLIKEAVAMCPSCGSDLIELHKDMTVSCVHCNTFGKFERRFGQNVIIWDEFSRNHSRATEYGAILHTIHIDISQTDDAAIIANPSVTDELLAPYKEYNPLVRP